MIVYYQKTREKVWKKNESIKNIEFKDVFLKKASGYEFYNTSNYDFEKLLADPENIERNFMTYLEGLSENVREIIEKFKFDNHITTMANKGILYIVIKEFTSPRADLHPDKISNLEMGYILKKL